MRLDKYIADMTHMTRSEVKQAIKDKRIKVNDEFAKADYQVKDSDVVSLDNQEIKYLEYEYYLLNKPQGYLTATEDKHYPIVMDLIQSQRKDLFPIGRLDKDTEGLLLISNDGDLSHKLLAPKSHVTKKYYVELDSKINENAKELLAQPIEFEEFTSSPAVFEKISDTSCYLTITEGKYHQVKRMFEHIGNTVIFLKRVEFAFLNLDGVNTGEFRALTDEEVEKLKNIA